MKLCVSIACVALLACDSSSSGSSSGVTIAPKDSATNVSAKVPLTHVEKHLAMYDGGQLSQCADISLEISATADARFFDDLLADAGTKLSQTCSAQFASHTAFATCASTMGAHEGTLFFFESYYEFQDAFGSDAMMKQCTVAKGKWQTISRDSDEFKRGKTEWDKANLGNMPTHAPN